jgi:hypothetical protein
MEHGKVTSQRDNYLIGLIITMESIMASWKITLAIKPYGYGLRVSARKAKK